MIGHPTFFNAFTDSEKLVAAFTSRQGGVSSGAYDSLNLGFFSGDEGRQVVANWRIALEHLHLDRHTLVMPRLSHGTQLFCVDAQPSPTDKMALEVAGAWRWSPSDCDAVATRLPGLALAVTMADCLGILIYDAHFGTIAAVHAGWRGTRDQILGLTLKRLIEKNWARPESLRVCLGPCLSTSRLELGTEVTETLDPRFVVQKNGRHYLELRRWNRAQAEAIGIAPRSIEEVEGCSFEASSQFFSYRRDGAKSGRMAAIIALK